MYYAIFDKQTGDYLATGLNSTSLEELQEAYISYKSIDTDIDFLKERIESSGLVNVLSEDDFIIEENFFKYE